jgi:flagellar biosynthesis/type III secretory pathway protein FliH
MMIDVTKYRYESFGYTEGQAKALEIAQREAQHAKELAEQIAAEVPPPPIFSEAELEAAKTAAFADGKKAGSDEVRKLHEELRAQEAVRVEELLQKIDAQVAGHAEKARAECEQIAGKLKAISYAAAKKIISNMPDAQLRQIENFIDGALGVASEEQKVELHLNPVAAKDFAGKVGEKFSQIKIVEDDSVLSNDLKITWNNGFAERKLDELWKEIGQIVVGEFNIDEFSKKSATNVSDNN